MNISKSMLIQDFATSYRFATYKSVLMSFWRKFWRVVTFFVDESTKRVVKYNLMKIASPSLYVFDFFVFKKLSKKKGYQCFNSRVHTQAFHYNAKLHRKECDLFELVVCRRVNSWLLLFQIFFDYMLF